MPNITIRNLELRFKRELRRRAAERGCSLEEEARDILRAALSRRPVGRRAAADRTVTDRSEGIVLDAPPTDLSEGVVLNAPLAGRSEGVVTDVPLSGRSEGIVLDAPPLGRSECVVLDAPLADPPFAPR